MISRPYLVTFSLIKTIEIAIDRFITENGRRLGDGGLEYGLTSHAPWPWVQSPKHPSVYSRTKREGQARG